MTNTMVQKDPYAAYRKELIIGLITFTCGLLYTLTKMCLLKKVPAQGDLEAGTRTSELNESLLRYQQPQAAQPFIFNINNNNNAPSGSNKDVGAGARKEEKKEASEVQIGNKLTELMKAVRDDIKTLPQNNEDKNLRVSSKIIELNKVTNELTGLKAT